MKRCVIGCLAVMLLLSSCGTGRVSSRNPGAVYAGASIGGNLGGAVGGLIGDNNHGRRGAYRGSVIGSIVGTVAGAAIASAATATEKEESAYRVERSYPAYETMRSASPLENLEITNIRFIDENRDHIISPGEESKVIFEIMNEGDEIIYNILPVVRETTGSKYIYISSSVLIEQIAPHEGIKYTATIDADEKLKSGSITLLVAVADEYGQEYDQQEFSLPTQR